MSDLSPEPETDLERAARLVVALRKALDAENEARRELEQARDILFCLPELLRVSAQVVRCFQKTGDPFFLDQKVDDLRKAIEAMEAARKSAGKP